MKNRLFSGLIVVCALAMVLCYNLVTRQSAFADDSALEAVSQSDYMVELTPTSRRMSFKPGEQKKDVLQLKNIGAKSVSVSVYATSYYTDDGRAGQNTSLDDSYTKISRWITFKDTDGEYCNKISFVLSPNQTREVSYVVDVPTSATGGGQYAILFAEFAPIKGDDNENATLSARSRVGMALFASIDDDGIVRSAEIKNIKALSGVALNRKINIDYNVENTGNIDFQASTDILVQSIFGKELYHNIAVETVFPGRAKDVRVEWENTPSFGIFRLDYAIKALDHVDEGSTTILVMSYGTIVLLVLILTGVGILIRYIRLKKRHGRRTKALGQD